MFQKPIVHSPAVQRLINEGYEVDIQHQHLLVYSVPYVTPNKEVDTGILVCPYLETNGMDSKPPDHTAWFKGHTPCTAQGKPLHLLINNSNPKTLFDHFVVQHYLSNKPFGGANFPLDYYDKMVHYIDLIVAQARVLSPDVDARTGKVIESYAEDAVFKYPDSASARAGIVAVTQKLSMPKVALVGTGGTGSYILDQVVKTPVKEIHLFDGGDFRRHNAFRAPGAPSIEMLKRKLKKTDYFCEMYGAMRYGMLSHPYYLDENNVSELEQFDFVFVSVDDGVSRGLICQYLQDLEIPFIDVGMGLEKVEDTTSLLGLCRVTLGTASKIDHLDKRLPVTDDRNDALYQSNIQVSDINALNAMLAVIKWKQYCGFYTDYDQAHNLSFSLAMQSLVCEDKFLGDAA